MFVLYTNFLHNVFSSQQCNYLNLDMGATMPHFFETQDLFALRQQQAMYDESYWLLMVYAERMRHIAIHLDRCVRRIERAAEDLSQVALDQLRSAVMPDVLMHALQLSCATGVDPGVAYQRASQSRINEYFDLEGHASRISDESEASQQGWWQQLARDVHRYGGVVMDAAHDFEHGDPLDSTEVRQSVIGNLLVLAEIMAEALDADPVAAWQQRMESNKQRFEPVR